MTDKEKLVEILKNILPTRGVASGIPITQKWDYEAVADKLIENGVIVMPCKEPLTNYDRIKSMSVEKMAEFLGETISGCPRRTEVCLVNATCTDCFKQYLESEVDNDAK